MLLMVLMLVLGMPAQSGDDSSPDNPLFDTARMADSAQVVFPGTRLLVPVAARREERTRGLQGRQHLGPQEGLLFVFPQIHPQEFWMKNTPVPLSIAWLSQEGKILEIQQMEPETTNLHQPGQPAAMALEMSRGWFQQHDLSVGDTGNITFLP